MGSYVSTVAPASTASPVQPTLIVIGSGLAGLTSALRFLQAAKAKDPSTHYKVLVLEADSVAGGRTRSTVLDKLPTSAPPVSYGGTWVILQDDSLIGLSNEVGWMPFMPTLVPNFSEGALHISFFMHPFLLLKLWVLGKQIYDSAKQPDDIPAHVELDSVDLMTWVDQNKAGLDKPEEAKNAVISWFFQVENYPSDISRMSAFFAAKAVYVRLSQITMTGFVIPKIMRWPKGTGPVVQHMVDRIQALGGEVILNARVSSITQEESGVVVAGSVNGQATSWSAPYVTVATALTNAIDGITYHPALEPKHKSIMPALKSWDDPSLQVVLGFSQQWWNKEHQGAYVFPGPIDDDAKGVYGPVMDLSEVGIEGSPDSPSGIIRIICKTSRCMDDGQLWTEDRIVESAIAYLARWHKKGYETLEQTEARIRSFLVQQWIYDWASQSAAIRAVTFYYSPTPEQIYARSAGNLETPFGRVFFASSERAKRGFNWMDGAVLSGQNSALSALQAHFGANWTAADTQAYSKEIEKNVQDGLTKIRHSGMDTLLNMALTTVKDFAFHRLRQPAAKSSDGRTTFHFRAPATDTEKAILQEFELSLGHVVLLSTTASAKL